MNNDLSTQEKWLILLMALVGMFAHLLNLGLMPLFGDEAIRGTVAFEMMKSDNYIVPTIWGEFYYKKPPLYNWLIIAFFRLADSFSLFVFRLPSVLPLFAFGGAIWFVARKQIGQRAAVFAAFAFVLSGRLLTRDSMLGHIDIFFSLVTFIGFYVVYHFWKRDRLWPLFLVSYALAGAGVLMKGLPSFLFQGLTLLVWFTYKRQFKRLFSIPHFAGIALFVAIVGGYFWVYSGYNSLEDYFFQLYDQSSQRTIADKEWYKGIVNIFTFPFENIMHLFPTSLLLVFMFRRGVIKDWLRDDFKAFTFLTLAVNVLPYWLSPGYFPRYLFMLYPLLFILGANEFESYSKQWPKVLNVLEKIMLGLTAILIPAFFVPLFLPELHDFGYLFWAAPLLALVSGALVWGWFKRPEFRTHFFFATLIVFRIGFDIIVLPYRVYVEENRFVYRLEESKKILALTEGEELRLLKDAPLFIDYAYHLGVGKDAIMFRDKEPKPGVYYLTKQQYMEAYDFEEFYKFSAEYRDYEISLVKLRESAGTNP